MIFGNRQFAFLAFCSLALYFEVGAVERFAIADELAELENATGSHMSIAASTSAQENPGLEFCGRQEYCCGDDLEVSSMRNQKIFLRPKAAAEKLGSWYDNVKYCRNHCAEMVTIQSPDENDFFKNWLRSGGILDEGAWLGGQVLNANRIVEWLNGDPSQYSNWASGEPNEGGVTCVLMGLSNTMYWRNYYCDATTRAIVCQRRWRLN